MHACTHAQHQSIILQSNVITLQSIAIIILQCMAIILQSISIIIMQQNGAITMLQNIEHYLDATKHDYLIDLWKAVSACKSMHNIT